jgi:hypothetical protein
MTENGLTVAEDQAFREKQSRFYALVGHCILRFQHVEGYLEDVFAAVHGAARTALMPSLLRFVGLRDAHLNA